jgi:hypothetical protein
MKTLTVTLLDALKTFGFLRRKPRSGPIDGVPGLRDFIRTRAAFVAQKTMYGYIQTRMGMQYPVMFQDADFVRSMKISKMHIFAACLSDLTIYGVAEATAEQPLTDAERAALALDCYRQGIEENLEHAPSASWADDAVREFEERLGGTDWRRGARMPENFTRSPRALVKWAPIAPDLKRHDTEIVENSIRYEWIAVRDDLRRRADRRAIAAEVLQAPLAPG